MPARRDAPGKRCRTQSKRSIAYIPVKPNLDPKVKPAWNPLCHLSELNPRHSPITFTSALPYKFNLGGKAKFVQGAPGQQQKLRSLVSEGLWALWEKPSEPSDSSQDSHNKKKRKLGKRGAERSDNCAELVRTVLNLLKLRRGSRAAKTKKRTAKSKEKRKQRRQHLCLRHS